MCASVAFVCYHITDDDDDDDDDANVVDYVGDSVSIAGAFKMESLLPQNLSDYYRYNGSLTTPPCYESVIWTVFKQPLTISPSQVISVKLADSWKSLRVALFYCLVLVGLNQPVTTCHEYVV